MSKKRIYFEITPVNEITAQPSTTVTINTTVDIVNEIPSHPPPPLAPPLPPSSLRTKRLSANFGTFLKKKTFYNRRRCSAANDTNVLDSKLSMPLSESSLLKKSLQRSNSLSILDSKETNDIIDGKKSTADDDFGVNYPSTSGLEYDPYSTTHSSQTQGGNSKTTNKFLNELRRKGRELREKRKDMSIEQRILQHKTHHLRAQDIFDVHFGVDDYDNNHVTWGWNICSSDEDDEQIIADVNNC
ncbi:unnamed protein product, partial [Didymodactylos carnosus]